MDHSHPRTPADLVKLMAELDDDPDDDGGESKAILVRWLPGDRVSLVGGEPGEWGFVVGVVCRPSGVLYQVSWPGSKTTTDHWTFELEDAD